MRRHAERTKVQLPHNRDMTPESPALERNARGRGRAGALAVALRPHQWIKNLLLLVPLVTAHRVGDPTAWRAIALAFVAFSCVASATYLVNDLLDREADRQHPRKRHRPIASGEVSVAVAVVAALALLAVATAISFALEPLFAACIAVYLATTLAYSFKLKRIAMIDVIVLASLYTLRVVAGNSALALELSFWLLAFAMFIFTSLALVKRVAELVVLRGSDRTRAAGRDYAIDDLPVLLALGTASGLLSVLVLALYVNSDASRALYSTPIALWLLCPLLLYWIARTWLVTQRGAMHDDPILYAVRDRVSLAIAALGAVVVYVAL